MDEALIDLLGKKDIQYISVKEICARAGVNDNKSKMIMRKAFEFRDDDYFF